MNELSSAARRPIFSGKVGATKFVVGSALMLLVIAFTVLVVRRRAEAVKEPLPFISRMDPFSLVDQRGKAFGLTDLDGKIWVADFIFTNCQAACPMLTTRMRALQKHVEEREQSLGTKLPIRFVSFSVDPEVDTPEKLAAYATKWGVDQERWSFLTGPLDEVNRAVVRGLKIHFEKGATDDPGKSLTRDTKSAFDVMHGEHFVIVDGQRRIRGYFQTDPSGMTELQAALASLIAETN
ncbi:MAG: SCO family protein [Polyangiaceae bacterium]